ncbi:hypothetical protein PHYPO_G00106460 [Pangasianodon hypophthalmus]|uniref:Uncharacterized protein n=1 Tax=Pangasianodon hypophthalmus TaxID=310915 RepID=A0A5N5PX94_PANHP|nr:hypothetical protein PHYPO_G00106460 [Pangasianodon hypophthalmus]
MPKCLIRSSPGVDSVDSVKRVVRKEPIRSRLARHQQRSGWASLTKPRSLMEAHETCTVITVTLQPRSLVGLFAFRLGRLCAEPERRLLSNAFRPPGEVKWTLD